MEEKERERFVTFNEGELFSFLRFVDWQITKGIKKISISSIIPRRRYSETCKL